MTQTLITWVGKTDLNAGLGKLTSGLGPVAGALTAKPFDRACLLCNYPDDAFREYLSWLGEQDIGQPEISTYRVALDDPTDFAEIYQAVTPVLAQVASEGRCELTFHLSPGTPSMAVVWILLASTRQPGRLIQTSLEHGLTEAKLPFEIAAEFIPDLVRRSREIEDSASALPPDSAAFDDILHRSVSMRNLIARAEMAARQDVPVLIEGESGTGKELLARAIHRASPRASESLLTVNCGAIPRELLESELFGHEKGAFTGADSQKRGLFEAANRGTILLDEVGELPLHAQVKLLRVLQERKLTRLGSTSEIPADVRIVAATNRNLIEEARAGRFRSDLFYRLAVAVLRVPPVREREGDITVLVRHYLHVLNDSSRQRQPRKLTPAARKELLRHSWPGNVRELVNTLTRAVIWSTNPSISKQDIREAILPSIEQPADALLNRPLGEGLDVRELVVELKRHYVERALMETRANKTRAAELIGLPNYQTLSNWMDTLGISTGSR